MVNATQVKPGLSANFLFRPEARSTNARHETCWKKIGEAGPSLFEHGTSPTTATTARISKMANDSLDDMLGWLDEAMGEKDVHHSPTIAVGRAGSHYGRSHSCDEIHHHQTHHNNTKSRAPSRRHHYTHRRSPEVDDYRNDHAHDDRGYQRASSYSAIDSREMTVSSYIFFGMAKLRATII